ncbi:ribosomal-processing cysteine protease Prp [Listeria costaricensis]|uniref:ribosomal-processing cysteine protease Prp n=1 Tax=Listeria costaricensis TaxID=2026604 RepID=UPI000C08348E|nr:ribosomal-processing cysteine protease Prp [Listeria costaricensis]
MIHVRVERKNNQIISFTMDGHADFAEHGSDLVCAGASSIAFGMINAIAEVMPEGFDPTLAQDEGYLYYELPAAFRNDQVIQTLLTGMVNQLRSLAYSYPDHIKINSK